MMAGAFSSQHDMLGTLNSAAGMGVVQPGVQQGVAAGAVPLGMGGMMIGGMVGVTAIPNGSSSVSARPSATKTCVHPGCTKGAIGKLRLCIAHGGGKRCSVQGLSLIHI